MTISTTTRTAGPFVGNDATTVFSFGFKVFLTSDIRVVRTNADTSRTTLTLGVDYSASLNANQNTSPGGTVTLGAVLATGTALFISSAVPATQPLSLANVGDFQPAAIENALDRELIILQQTALMGQDLRVPDPEGIPVLGDRAARANKLLGFDSNGDPVTVAPSVDSASQLAADLASSDPTKGSSMVKHVAADVGAQGRSVQDKLRERISVLDFMTDAQRADVTGNVGALDVTTGIQAAIDYLQAASRGGIVWLPAGRYRITANLLITWPNAAGPDEPSRVVLQGDGPGMTIIDDWRTAGTASIRGAVSIDMDGYTGAQVDARNLESDFGNFSLIRRTSATSITVSGDGGVNYVIGTGTALYLTNLPSVSGRIFNIRAIGYHTGVNCTGILGLQFDRVNIQQAEYGWFILGNGVFEPNSLLFSNCTVAACRTWGYRIVDGGAIEWHGGVITGCGQMTGDAGGILYKASAIQPTGIDVSDVYFEANRGLADVVIDVAVGAPVIQPNTVRHCLFARNFADFYTTNNVLVRVSGTLNGTLALIANGHRGFGTYVPSASRKYVGTVGSTTGLEIVHIAPKYESATEDPRIVAAAVHAPSFGVGTSTVAITSNGNNLVLGDSLAIVPGFGPSPPTTNVWQFGSPLLRWSTAYTVNLDASGTFTWGSHVYSLPPGTGTKFLRDDGSWVTLGSGAGTVTSVSGSGGTTGLTLTGGPITSTGTLTLGGTLAVANGGTGVATSTGSGSTVLNTSPTLAGTVAFTGGTATIASSGNNLVFNGIVSAVGATGFGPVANNTYACGGTALRWAGMYSVALDLSGALTWGAYSIAAPTGGTTSFLRNDGTWAVPAGSGSGTVTSFSFTNGNGITGTVTNPTSTPALSFSLGAVTGTSFNGVTGLSSTTPSNTTLSAAVGTGTTAAHLLERR